MKMIVCIKQVPSSNKVRMDPDTHTIIRDGKQSVINPYDAFALEEALKLKAQLGGHITLLTMGIPETAKILRDACTRGADKMVLLSDRAFAGADTLATAYTLAKGVEAIGSFDLILCGKMAIDGDTAQIGPELAENLGIGQITDVEEIMSCTTNNIQVKKAVENGYEILAMPLPGLITVNKGINLPRLATLSGFEKAMGIPVETYPAHKLGVDCARTGLKGSPTQVVETFVPKRDWGCNFITAEASFRLIKTLKNNAEKEVQP